MRYTIEMNGITPETLIQRAEQLEEAARNLRRAATSLAVTTEPSSNGGASPDKPQIKPATSAVGGTPSEKKLFELLDLQGELARTKIAEELELPVNTVATILSRSPYFTPGKKRGLWTINREIGTVAEAE